MFKTFSAYKTKGNYKTNKYIYFEHAGLKFYLI